MFFLKPRIKRKKSITVDRKELGEVIRQELEPYVRKEDIKTYLEGIEKDKRKKRLWDSLTTRQKIRVLRYRLGKDGAKYGGR